MANKKIIPLHNMMEYQAAKRTFKLLAADIFSGNGTDNKIIQEIDELAERIIDFEKGKPEQYLRLL